MRFVGSKNRISKELAPIIQNLIDSNNISNYIEPFVGGANMIDKIECDNKIGYDIHEELIELLNKAKYDYENIQDRVLEDEYHEVRLNKDKYPKWKVGLVGFCSSFGAKYFGGYARNSKSDITGEWSAGAIRNLKKQAPLFKNITFINSDYRNLDIKDSVIYCDPPYKNTTKYKHGDFNHDEFYEWCVKMANDNIVLVSEYNVEHPNFKEIWNKEVGMMLGSGINKGGSQNRIERLYRVQI